MNKRFLIFVILPVLIAGFFVWYFINRSEVDDGAGKTDNTVAQFSKEITTNDKKEDLDQNDPSSISALGIIGDDDFKTKIKDSLRLLWLYDRAGSFMLVRRYIFEIRQSNRTTFFMYDDKPVCEISDERYRNSSEEYLASVIAHMAWHGWYASQNKVKKIAKEVPLPGTESIDKTLPDPVGVKFKKLDDLYKVEGEAFDYQLSVLKKIKAKGYEIKLIEKREYTDFSPAHDGNYFIDF